MYETFKTEYGIWVTMKSSRLSRTLWHEGMQPWYHIVPTPTQQALPLIWYEKLWNAGDPPSAFRFLILLSCHFNYQASIIDWCIVTHNLFVHQDVDSGDNWFLCIIPRRESNSSILVCNLFLSLKLIKFKCIVSQIGCSAIIYTSYIASYIYHTITVLVPLGKNMFYCTSCPRAIYQARATLWWKYLSLKYRSRGTLYRIGSLQTDNKVSLISQVTAHCLYICITW